MSCTAAETSLREGRLEESLQLLQAAVRARPAEKPLRLFLFQLLCVMGRWQRAAVQLQVIRDLDGGSSAFETVFRRLVSCEVERAEVFGGKRTPLIFGEPPEWMGLLVQANAERAAGRQETAAAILGEALEQAPAVAGHIDDEEFAWIADGDSRLGPVCEAIIEGTYYWVPMTRLKEVVIEKPRDLRDSVWVPAHLTFTHEGALPAHLPARYFHSEDSLHSDLLLARATEWREEGDYFIGSGQRQFVTDRATYPILEVRKIVLNHA